jgi:L-ascorbate metabolism protein UlaG (beta-lactamase superfamily)
MRLIKFGHACVRLETDSVLVIDPGVFTERAALEGADAILVTHEHFDHLNAEAIADEVGKRPHLRIYAHESVVPKLEAVAGNVTAVGVGDEFTAAGLRVRAYGGMHAQIHPDVPRIANLAYLVEESVYHPGDSFHVPEGATVDTLLTPISAPWLKLAEVVDFVRAVAPRRAVAIHEGLLNDVGLSLADNLLKALGRTEYQRVAAGTEIAAQ